MNMSKFERRRLEAQRKFEEEMKALEEAEAREVKKKIDPIVSKIGKLAEEEARKALEANPDVLETYSFRKREAAREVRALLDRMFSESHAGEAEEAEEDAGEASAPSAPKTSSGAEKTTNAASEEDPFTSDLAEASTGRASEARKEDIDTPEAASEKKGFGPFGR